MGVIRFGSERTQRREAKEMSEWLPGGTQTPTSSGRLVSLRQTIQKKQHDIKKKVITRRSGSADGSIGSATPPRPLSP
ncbi:MAG: hypothetical protein LLG97_02875 [Deltaproteobacteria bacterium]|nr:hypothetical protein [Deltaproteobacteria bacterium]